MFPLGLGLINLETINKSLILDRIETCLGNMAYNSEVGSLQSFEINSKKTLDYIKGAKDKDLKIHKYQYVTRR